MSRTGIEPCSAEVMQQLAIVCSFVCMCNENGGQICVDGSLLLYNTLNKNSQILVEHPYYLPEEKAPVPIMNSGGWNDFIPSLGRLIGSSRLAKTEGIPQNVIDAYLKREINMAGVRTIKGYESIESYEAGELSIPDTVIVQDRNMPAVWKDGNLLGVGEIKFPPDDWNDRQYEAATRIAGDEKKVHTLNPTSCMCSGKKQNLREEVGQPAELVAAIKKRREEEAQMLVSVAAFASSIARVNPYAAATEAFFEVLGSTPAY